MRRKETALTALAGVACVSLALSRLAHPALAPACLVFVLFKHTVMDRRRGFVLPDLLFVVAHALLFIGFLWFVLFSQLTFDHLAVLLGFATLWMLLRSFAQPTPYNDFLLVLASLVIVVGSAAAAPGFLPAVITGAYLLVACQALPHVMTRTPGEKERDEDVHVRLVGRAGRWRLAGGFAVHHLALAGLLVGSLFYLGVPRLERDRRTVAADDAAAELLAARRQRRGAEGDETPPVMVTGFPETIRLGDIGTLKRRAGVAFHAWLRVRGREYDPSPAEAAMLLFRADAWEQYSVRARRWTRDESGRYPLDSKGNLSRGAAPVDWSVRMRGYDGKKLFLPQRTRRVRVAGRPVYVDRLGSVTSPRAVRDYGVEADMPVMRRADLARLRPDDLRRGLLHVPPQLVRQLTPYLREIVASAESRPRPGQILAAVDAIRLYFESCNFRYTLELPPSLPGDIDPMTAFLQRREGHCELYASTACMLLRMLQVPARLAGGVRCADRVEPSHYRAWFRNAHAWVEVACKGVGFVAFDFTPSDSRAVPASGAAAAGEEAAAAAGGPPGFDWRDPFRYGRDEQRELLQAAGDVVARLVLPIAALAAVLVLAGVVGGRRRRRSDPLQIHAPRGVSRRSLAFYARFLKECAQKGHVRRLSQTPREFLRRLPPELRREGRGLTADFERLRYGSTG